MDPYRVLGLQHDADTGQIRAAFRQRARLAHPDAGGTDTAFFRLQEAYRAALSFRSRTRSDRDHDADDGGRAAAGLRRQFRIWRRLRAWRQLVRRPVLHMLAVQVVLVTVVAVAQPSSPVMVVLGSLTCGGIVGAMSLLVAAHRQGRL